MNGELVLVPVIVHLALMFEPSYERAPFLDDRGLESLGQDFGDWYVVESNPKCSKLGGNQISDSSRTLWLNVVSSYET
jgi:hypothetical protein